MAEVVGPAVVEVGKCAYAPLKEHVGYLMHFNDNVKDMRDRLQELVARKEDIDELVSRGRSNGEAITREVRLWLTRADDMKAEAAGIEQRVSENKRCLCCPNLSWRYSISKQAKQAKENIAKHHNDGNFERVTSPSSPPAVENQPAPSIQGLSSVESSLQKVMSALSDENTKIIGVWGMGGVGKTTLVKNVNNELQGTQQFNKVIMVIVSEDVDIKRIQGDIAKRLGFTLQDGTSKSSRASDLRNRLMQEKKFLVILDDLWERLDLADVGIPSTNSPEGCKIIFTTRYKDVCQGMESQVDIQVEVLSEEESWKLFKEKAGAVVDNSSLQSKAKEVLKECGGLPLAIITLGWALRGRRNPKEWDNALSQLKKSVPSDIKGMENGVYHSIKISYDHLRPQLKPAFLFCCLFPEDYDIHVDWMIRLWKGEGFLEDVESLEEALNKGHSLVEELKSSCLLLAGEKEGYVKMHDIVRDVAIWISSKECKDYKSFVRIGLKGLPRGKCWEEYKRISLWGSGINKLPEGMHCPKLLTLMMPENKQLTEIQGWFWEATKDLRVLDLSRTAISKIPLSNLVNLRVLCLRSCKFEDGNCLSSLGGLKELEFLDLSFNDWLRELPNEIGELVNLRSLDLTKTVNLKIVPSGVISRLTLLEELKMWNSFHEWKAEEKDASSSSSSCNASLSEVASLKELSNLHLCIVEVERFPQDYPLIKHLTKLKKFCFCICPRPVDGVLYLDYPRSNPNESGYMEIDGCSLIPEWALMLLPETTHLHLINCKGQETLNRCGGFPSLKSLTVRKCDDVEFVVSAKESPENAFGNLQTLRLTELPNLKKVVTKYEEGLLPTHLLHNLKELRAEKCPKLKHLLPSVLLQGMDNLTDVRVSDCEGMEHLFDGPPEQRNDMLSKLRRLYLSNLTSMTSIWPIGLVVKIQNLASLSVRGCHGLKKSVVSAMQMKGGLPNLADVWVNNCGGVEEIISDVVDNEGLLPKLENLTLSSLPELVRIYGGGEAVPPPQLDWHSLETIRVSGCPKLKKVQPLQGGADSVVDLSRTAISKIPLSNLVNLRELCLSRCKFEEGNCLSALGGLKQLEFLDLSFNDWLCELPNEIGELVNLRRLDLTNTINLKIVPSGVISRLTLLKELKMWNSFQEWKAEEKDASSSSSSSNASLSEVASLKELSNLHLCIVEVERFPQDYPLIKHPTKLKKFHFRICQRPDDGVVDHMYSASNYDELKYMELVGYSFIPEWALMLLPETTHLHLINCKGQETLNRCGGFPSLKSLTVRKCDDVEFVVSAKESPENAFGNLQRLELSELPNLKKVVTKYEEGLLPTHLLHNLRELRAEKCPELKHLFPSVLLQGMDNLTEVLVSGCEGMEHLFDGPPTVEQRNDVLFKLKNLEVNECPELKHLLPSVLLQGMDNLTHVTVTHCEGMEHLFDGPPQRNDVLSKLETLAVQGCHGLKKSVVSAMQMKGGLPNLFWLTVADCGGVEEIISDVVDNEGLLPELEILRLTYLPELVRIYGGGEAVPPPQLDWHSLKTIDVYECPKLKKVQALQGGATSVPSLQLIRGERNWWEGLDWEGDDRVISQFHSLFKQVTDEDEEQRRLRFGRYREIVHCGIHIGKLKMDPSLHVSPIKNYI